MAIPEYAQNLVNLIKDLRKEFAELSPCPTHGHHWFANAESYFLIGDAAGEGMKGLIK